jgi:hypothetical protein
VKPFALVEQKSSFAQPLNNEFKVKLTPQITKEQAKLVLKLK